MLESMKDGEEEDNQARQAAGYSTAVLQGWAERPHYDSAEKKLYWAKDILFSDSGGVHTLNYDVRILGRRGVLVMTAVADVDQLEEVADGAKLLLARTTFNEGHRYEDFNAGTDKLAAYGVGGLIAGKFAAKAGFFKAISLFLAKAWKLVAVAVIGQLVSPVDQRTSTRSTSLWSPSPKCTTGAS